MADHFQIFFCQSIDLFEFIVYNYIKNMTLTKRGYHEEEIHQEAG